jgi:serine O-acetyltransferase
MLILQDLKHKTKLFYGEYRAALLLRTLLTDGTLAMLLFRLVGFINQIGLGPLGSFVQKLNTFLTGSVIGRRASFGAGFVIMHSQGVVINGAVRGGTNIVVESGVVIGTARYGLPVKAPTLGNEVFVGTGAKIIGGITIGNGVRVGANAVVLDDVPDGATVVGIPSHVVKTRSHPVP